MKDNKEENKKNEKKNLASSFQILHKWLIFDNF